MYHTDCWVLCDVRGRVFAGLLVRFSERRRRCAYRKRYFFEQRPSRSEWSSLEIHLQRKRRFVANSKPFGVIPTKYTYRYRFSHGSAMSARYTRLEVVQGLRWHGRVSGIHWVACRSSRYRCFRFTWDRTLETLYFPREIVNGYRKLPPRWQWCFFLPFMSIHPEWTR